MHVISPRSFPNLESFRQMPLFFLAGPILGGGDWHFRMTNLLAKAFDDCLIANPAQYREPHPFAACRMVGGEGHFSSTLAWERYFLNEAAEGWPIGCIIFWLCPESRDNPRRDGSPFAMDTRGEIGEWRGRLMSAPRLRVVIGSEPDFPGLRVIKANFKMAVPNLQIVGTMGEVVERAKFFANPANFCEARSRRLIL